MNKIKLIATVIVLLFLLIFDLSAKEKEKDQRTDTHSKIVKTNDKANSSKTDAENRFPSSVSTSPASGEQINWQVISSGGTIGSSTNYILAGTIGQTAVGISSSTNYNINSGYWQVFGPTDCCVGNTGDINYDGGAVADISDLLYLVDFMFTPGSPDLVCMAEGDVNGDGSSVPDISDLLFLVDFMFYPGSPEPSPCL